MLMMVPLKLTIGDDSYDFDLRLLSAASQDSPVVINPISLQVQFPLLPL